MIKKLVIDLMAGLLDRMNDTAVEDYDPVLDQIMTAEVNAMNQVFFDLNVGARFNMEDILYSATGNFIRYRASGPGLKLSKVQSYAADLQAAINDNRRSLPGAAKVIVRWRDGLSFDVPYPLETEPLTWEDVKEIKSLKPFQMLIGRNYETEQPCTETLDFADESLAHVLVSGGSGSGKSVLLINLITSLCWSTSPDKAIVIILDTKHGPTIKALTGLPHVILCNEIDECITAIHAVQAELQRRKKAGNDGTKVFLVLEELADLMTATDDPDSLWQPLIRMSSTSREFGIHMIACTQYANTEVINANFRTNFLTRIGGQFATDMEGRVATGRDDLRCSTLPGKGAFYLVHQMRVSRIQTCNLKGKALTEKVREIASRHTGITPYRITMNQATVEAPATANLEIDGLISKYGKAFVESALDMANDSELTGTALGNLYKELTGKTMNGSARKEVRNALERIIEK